MYSLGKQLAQPPHTGELASLLKRPEAHGAHARSVVGLPSPETNSPGMHSRCSTQGVAAFKS
jgi:hypothetical protein